MGTDSNYYNIRDHGATGLDDASAVEPLQELARLSQKGTGCVIHLPPGHYRSGPLKLGSHTTLRIDAGATLAFVPEFDRYRPVQTRWEGEECFGLHPLIFGSEVAGVVIEGDGVVEGSGEPWWEELKARRVKGETYPLRPEELELAELNGEASAANSGGGGREMQFLRPPLIQFFRASDIAIRGVTCRNSPFWNTHIVYSDNVDIDGVTFASPPDSPNTDGLNIDSSSNVRIRGCHFDVGDDCIGLKSGSGPDGLRVNRPTENVTIFGCTMHRGHGGVVVGSETAGGVKNVTVTGCVFDGTDRGIRIKSRRGRGGSIDSLLFTGITMRNVIAPLVINLFYRCGTEEGDAPLFEDKPQPLDRETPSVRRVSVSGLLATKVRGRAGFLAGLPESPLSGISLSDLFITLAEEEGPGSEAPRAEAAMSRGITPPAGGAVCLHHVEGLATRNVTVRRADGTALSEPLEWF